jgi:hypothetical protein
MMELKNQETSHPCPQNKSFKPVTVTVAHIPNINTKKRSYNRERYAWKER